MEIAADFQPNPLHQPPSSPPSYTSPPPHSRARSSEPLEGAIMPPSTSTYDPIQNSTESESSAPDRPVNSLNPEPSTAGTAVSTPNSQAQDVDGDDIMENAPIEPTSEDIPASEEARNGDADSSAGVNAEADTGASDTAEADADAEPEPQPESMQIDPPADPVQHDGEVVNATGEASTTEQPAGQGENGNTSPEADMQPAPPQDGDDSTEESSQSSARSTDSSDSTEQTREDDRNSQSSQEDTEERPFWAELVEDTSVPDEEELKAIEATEGNYSALDYNHWENTFFSEIDEPEYKPTEKARITWKIKGVRGTKERPNRARILQSPPVYLGGYYWIIKFFPRGNDGFDLSVYLECFKTPPEQDKANILETEFRVLRGPHDADLSKSVPDVEFTSPAVNLPRSSVEKASQAQTQVKDVGNTAEPDSDTPAPQQQSWRVSAQVGVVLYNPDEPTTAFSKASTHQFSQHLPDWGWSHFHGPWDTIHERRKGQKQALLRNDTLSFDAYIRIVEDSTQFLWWRSSDNEVVWDSFGLTGYKPIGERIGRYRYETAGIVPWLLLSPFREAIQSADIVGYLTDSNIKPRWLCEELQLMLWKMRNSPTDSLHYVSNAPMIKVMQLYRESSGDVIEFWERVRRTLQLELAGTEMAAQLSNLFDSPAPTSGEPLNMLPRDFNSRIRFTSSTTTSVQSGLSAYLSEKSGKWSLPPVLHIELARYKFDRPTRQWKLDQSRVTVDEEVDLAGFVEDGSASKYSLYCVVVHKGLRTSREYYSILRPAGPGGHWLAFKDGKEVRVECLTRKKVIEGFAGHDPASERAEKSSRDIAVGFIYVRNDVVPSYLTGKLEQWDVSKEWHYQLRNAIDYPFTYKPPQYVKIEFYCSRGTENMNGSNDLDPYELMQMSKLRKEPEVVTVPLTTTVGQIMEKAAALLSTADRRINKEHIRLWCLNHQSKARTSSHRLISMEQPQTPLLVFYSIPLRMTPWGLDIIRFWAVILNDDQIAQYAIPEHQRTDDPFSHPVAEPTPAPEPQGNTENNDVEMNDAPTDEPSNPDAETVPEGVNETQNTSPDGTPNTATLEDPSSRPQAIESEPSTTGDTNAAARDEDTPAGDDNAVVRDEDTPAGDDNTAIRDENTLAADDNTTVANENPVADNETNDNPTIANDDAAAANDSVIAEIIAQEIEELDQDQSTRLDVEDPRTEDSPMEEAPDPPLEEASHNSDIDDDGERSVASENSNRGESPLVNVGNQVYYFIQIFDEVKQEIRTVGSFFAKISEDIYVGIRAALGWEADKAFRIWLRNDSLELSLVTGGNYENVFCNTLAGGCVIVGNIISDARVLELAQAGSFSEPDRLLQYQWAMARGHPTAAFTGTMTSEPAINGDFYSGELNKGYYHGKGTHISDSGDTYTGTFVQGIRHGSGNIEYVSGDTFEGGWAGNLPHGQGTFIERKTGNKYVGGYQDGKRHGKGVTYWEVADEEMNTCQICYLEEQDALFYPCGHVCACTACAKQVDICPVCRDKVVQVVKIYRC
ncbi:hypothetical protein FQN57_001332 [Myotisia sp. PD_48]|nr:hypothetical protein FQN57_001332 [Myotisia sp. PD_48]